MSWIYPPELLDAVAPMGLAPTADTPPLLVREAVNDLYRFELRRARERLRGREGEKADYFDLIVAIRKRYWVLTLPAVAWERIVRTDPDIEDLKSLSDERLKI